MSRIRTVALPAYLEIECIEIASQIEEVGGPGADGSCSRLASRRSSPPLWPADELPDTEPAHVTQKSGRLRAGPDPLKRVEPKMGDESPEDETHPRRGVEVGVDDTNEACDHSDSSGVKLQILESTFLQGRNSQGEDLQAVSGYHQASPDVWPPWRVHGAMLALFLLGAVLGASPRAITLAVIAQMVPPPTMETLDDLKSVFAPCKEEGAAFTNISPDGLQYRLLIQTDHAFYGLGLTTCYVSLLIIVSPSIVWKSRDWLCRSYKVLLGICVAGQVVNVSYLLWKESYVYAEPMNLEVAAASSHWILDHFIYATLVAFCVSYALLANFETALLSTSGEVSRRPGRKPWLAQCAFNVLSCLTMTGQFVFLTFGGLYPTGRVLSLMEVLYLSFTCRALNAILRGLAIQNIEYVSTRTVLCINLVGVLVISTTSVGIRLRGLEYTDSDILDAILSSILVGFAEVVSFLAFICFNQFGIAKRLKDINCMTLGQALDAHRVVQKQMFLSYGHRWSSESAEIFVCVVIAAQELAMPVWNQYRTFYSLADISAHRTVRCLTILMIRLVFEIGISWRLFSWCHKMLPTNVMLMFRRSITKSVVCCYLGIIMYLVVAFWPRCHLCQQPQASLVYLLCLRHGRLMLDGQNACRSNFGWTAQGIENLLQASNISRSDMGCDRWEVVCPTHRHLKPGEVCDREWHCSDPTLND